jgi:hypothetical protein
MGNCGKFLIRDERTDELAHVSPRKGHQSNTNRQENREDEPHVSGIW